MSGQTVANERQWSGKTGGGNFGQRFLLSFLKKVKVTFLYPFLIFVVPVYCIVNHKAFGCIFRYFNQIHDFSKWKSFWNTVQNHLIFGKVVLDRFAILAGNDKQFQIDVPEAQDFVEMLNQPRGFIVAGSHVGNFELVGHFFKHDQKPINIIVYDGENADFQSRRRDSFLAHNVKMIPVKEDLSHIFAIKAALDNGEIVAILCDRIFGSSKALEVDFLGRKAKFPLGTFVLAAQMEVPMVLLVAVKQHRTRYLGSVRKLPTAPDGMNIRGRSKFLAEQYAEELGRIVRKHPEQWFNFYDFWA